MEELRWIWDLLREWVPTLVVLLIGTGLISGARYVLLGRWGPPPGQGRMTRQILIVALSGIALVVFILSLPIGDAARGQLLSLLGLLITAAVALSSTTLLGNAMAGFMLRAMRNFRAGDFIIVEEHRGRVSEKGWLRTEIQTERRNLTTLPNLYLVTNPMTVIRSSGTFISATVSLGYDVPRAKIEQCLLDAAHDADLEDPFVFVTMLGDFSITYQVAGFLEEVKYLISAESKLRGCMLDALHRAGIEIVSPTFTNQRRLDSSQVFIPKDARTRRRASDADRSTQPEERMFDKAEQAESDAKVEEQLKAVTEEIDALKKSDTNDDTTKARIEELKQKRDTLDERVRALAEQKNIPENGDGAG
ncbi:MAG: mechanosensitive ion channel domain-containing protein [Myxococcota bacterium]